jgi:hypothetical protein
MQNLGTCFHYELLDICSLMTQYDFVSTLKAIDIDGLVVG